MRLLFFRRQGVFFRRQRRKVRLRLFTRIENKILYFYQRLFFMSRLSLYSDLGRISPFSSLEHGAGDVAFEVTRKTYLP